jgi:flagellar protein FlaG
MSIDKIAQHSPIVSVKRSGEPVAATPSEARAVSATKEPTQAPAQVPPDAQLADIAKQLDSYIRSVSRSLEFKVDAQSGRTVISVRDAQTGDLIRQIPNEEALRFAQMAEEQTIVLLKETV